MRLVVIAIGRLKQGPERELAERYRERSADIGRKLGFRGLEIIEIPESRARDATSRMAEEATAISAAMPESSVLVALDERGENLDSVAFSRHLGRWRDEGIGNTIFAIGGADGLSPDLRGKAKLRMGFGVAAGPPQPADRNRCRRRGTFSPTLTPPAAAGWSWFAFCFPLPCYPRALSESVCYRRRPRSPPRHSRRPPFHLTR